MAAESSPELGDMLFIQFARSPEPGQVKTRMIPSLDAEQACALHEELLLWTCRRLCAIGPVELWVSGSIDHRTFEACRELGVTAIREQIGSDLGERMGNALADGLSRYQRVVLVGSDCPFIDEQYLRSAHSALDSSPVVIGPADDGGYVLIGVRGHCPEIFSGVAWGRSQVFAQTVELLAREKVEWQSLESLPDIDRPEDLSRWYTIKEREAGRR